MDPVAIAKQMIEVGLSEAPTGYALIDPKGAWLSWNPAFAERIDPSVNALRDIGLTGSDDWNTVLQSVSPDAEEASQGQRATLALDPSRLSAKLTFTPIRDAENRVLAIMLAAEPAEGDIPEGSRDAYETALEQSRRANARFERLIENVPGGIYEVVSDRDGNQRFVYASQKTGELAGTTSEAILADVSQAYARIHPDDAPRLYARTAEALETLKPFEVVVRFMKEDGDYRWVRITSTVMEQPDGAVSAYGNLFDVTEEIVNMEAVKAAAEAAQTATARVVRLTENVPGGIYEFVVDAKGRVSFPYATPTVGPLLGTKSDILRSDASAAFSKIHKDDLAAFQSAIEQSQQTLQLFDRVIRIVQSDDSIRWLRVRASPMERPEGGVIWYGSLFDITEEITREKDLEDALNAAKFSTARLEHLAENVPGGIFECIMDADGAMRFPFVTSGMGELLGTTSEAMKRDSTSGFEYIHPDDLDGLMSSLQTSRETLGTFRYRYRVNHPTKGQRWISVNSTPAPRKDGGVIWYGSLFDVTEDVMRERTLERTAKVARETSSRLEMLTDNVPGGIVEFSVDRAGEFSFHFFSDGWTSLIGVAAETFRTDPKASFHTVHPDDLEELQRAIAESAKTLNTLKISHRILHPERGLRWARITATPVAAPDGGVVWYGSAFDVTEEMEREKALEVAVETANAATARLERLTQNVPGALFEYRSDVDGNGTIPYATQNYGSLLGKTNEELLKDAHASFEYIHPDDAERVVAAITQSRENLTLFNTRYRINHPERGLRWLQARSTPIAQPDRSVVFYGSYFDVTEEVLREQELEDARARMEELSFIDSLTGLPNRRAFDAEMEARRKNGANSKRNQVIIRIDLDHFKAVNDTLGHAAGDAVLCRVGAILCDVMKNGDFAARVGGDEFVIMLAPGRTEADAVIETVHSRIKEPFDFAGRMCRFDASFGLASTDVLPDNPSELLSFADAALFEAKGRGRGQVARYTKDLHENLVRNRRRSGEIQQALEREEFVPFFHPQIDAATGAIAGFEVLARWFRPGEGLVPPDEFIPVAEQMRVVEDIDRMMFVKAIDVLTDLQSQGLTVPKLAFNVSLGRIHDPDIVKSIDQLNTHGTKVAFELLESILLEEEGAVFEHNIDLLKDLGVDIEVDDFGSGRASIIGVMRVAPTALKIDRRLVAPLLESGSARGLVGAIIDMARALKIDVIAEGVESLDHAFVLRDMGCKTLQGFAFARPMPPSDVRDYIERFEPTLLRSTHSTLSQLHEFPAANVRKARSDNRN